jgi:UDP-2,3-diacylglucosamine pyrophosphatase LpxH
MLHWDNSFAGWKNQETVLRKREVDLVIISDVHLGTFGCRAKELLEYLRSIKPKMLILNGDIIDIWQFRKRYFPKSHLLIIRHLTGMMAKNTKVIYITGNHDELMRKFTRLNLGSFKLVNKVLLDLDGAKTWIFHGDVFDVTMQYSKWLAKLGSVGYDLLILLNSLVNFFMTTFGGEKISFSKRIKNGVRSAVSFISRFEETAASIAISKGYDNVVCGHIHQPVIRKIKTNMGQVTYMNSGDWIENLTALEYNRGEWSIYKYHEDLFAKEYALKDKQPNSPGHKETFRELVLEMTT